MNRAKNTVCALVSGGIDSCVMLGILAKNYAKVVPVYVTSGFIWEKAELFWLKKYFKTINRTAPASAGLSSIRVLKAPVPQRKKHWSFTGHGTPGYNSPSRTVYLPGRNITLLSVAALFCLQENINRIALGVLKHNPFPDSTFQFFNIISRALSLGLNHPIKIMAPLAKMTKKQVILTGKDLPLHLTFSCISPRGLKPCGNCNKCAERDKVLRCANAEFASCLKLHGLW